MISCKYKLVSDQDAATETYYHNELFENFDNIALIEGPNNRGKSTLLHIIAMSCYGKKFGLSKIKDEGLLEKINWLSSSPKTKIEFELVMDMPDIKFVAEKKLNSSEIIRKVNGKYTSFDNFRDQFDLIYDIPTNPTARLKEIVKTVETDIKDYGRKITIHATAVRDILESMNQDPKKMMQKYKNAIADLDTAKETKKNSINDLKLKSDNLDALILFKRKYNCEKDIDTCSNKLKKLSKKVGKEVKSTIEESKTVKKLEDFLITINALKNSFISKIELLDISESINSQIESLKNLDIDEDYKLHGGTNFWDLVLNIDTDIGEFEQDTINPEIVVICEFYRQLKSMLNDIPPEVTDESVTFPVNVLKDEINSYLNKHSDKDLEIEFDEIHGIKNEIDSIFNTGDNLYKKLNNLSASDREAYDLRNVSSRIKELKSSKSSLTSELKQIDAEILVKELEKKFTDLNTYLASIRHHYPDFESKSVSQLKNLQVNLETNIVNEKDKLKDIVTRINYNTMRYNEAEKMEEPKYVSQKKLLNRIETHLYDLSTKFNQNLPEYAERLNSRTAIQTNDKNEKQFREDFQYFLASKIPSIPIDNNDGTVEDYKVSRIDMVKKLFFTDDGRQIEFLAYGSGRTSSLSLISRINNLDPDKISILLLDEALMDDVSIKPVKKTINNLYHNNRLLAGLLVRYAEKPIEIQSLISLS